MRTERLKETKLETRKENGKRLRKKKREEERWHSEREKDSPGWSAYFG